MQDKNYHKNSKLNLSRACLNTLRLSEFLMYRGSLFHSLLAVNEKDLCIHSVLNEAVPGYFPYPLGYNINPLNSENRQCTLDLLS